LSYQDIKDIVEASWQRRFICKKRRVNTRTILAKNGAAAAIGAREKTDALINSLLRAKNNGVVASGVQAETEGKSHADPKLLTSAE
jgi:hypothetical protein